MQVNKTPIEGLLEVTPSIYHDERGWFFEFYSEREFQKHGIATKFVQENQSFTKKGTIRGLHFQKNPHAQAKLVSVMDGKVLDVVVDLRKNSKTFGQSFTYVLESSLRNMLFIPTGFAHGFAALEDSVFFYKCSDLYYPELEGGIIWNDPALAIDWQIEKPLLSPKDERFPTLEEFIRKSVISQA